ncbi:MAG TPA: SUMF1/EgtB/PvdO family nonheme iron enzyme [Candidatus Polarisedimenticolaceae bacterium]|nr:SUMF1/EgtB/PvdO family nonheme iron enzyme [Candidatus Polarisedimenticolaceae bacterium]
MKTSVTTVLALVLWWGLCAAATAATCAPDAVPAGTVCLDRYEATVWRVPNPTTTNAPLVRKIQSGLASRLDLVSSGATQLGLGADNYTPCTDNGQSCAGDIFAISLPSEIPSAFITWFQAQEACASSGKRLPTSAEWQVGADGTPDAGPDNGTTDCNSASGGLSATGSRSACVSARGAFDMAGNLEEWVADWTTLSSVCTGWGIVSDDRMCLAGASTIIGGPGALTRGGSFVDHTGAGPLAVIGARRPTAIFGFIGFRCAAENAGPVPAEVDNGVRVSRSGLSAVLKWNVASGATTSSVLRGHVKGLPVGTAGADERCLVSNLASDTFTDPELPSGGDAFWYLIRGENVGGSGPYGFEETHGAPSATRVSTACP